MYFAVGAIAVKKQGRKERRMGMFFKVIVLPFIKQSNSSVWLLRKFV
jgi:hypothetical protein